MLKSVETEKKLNNLFVLEVVKLNYELELKCYKQAVNTFSKILKMQDPVITPWPFLVRAAFLLGKIEELYKSYILWGIGINKFDLKSYYNNLFVLYIKVKHGQSDIPSLKELINDTSVSNDFKSSVCYLLSMAADEGDKTTYLEQGYSFYSFNFSIVAALLRSNTSLDTSIIKDYVNIEPECLQHVIINSEDELNIDVSFCAIGGGNNIGGSCYLLKLENINVIIDAGIKFGSNNEAIYPDFTKLEKYGLKSLEDIDLFILTHAHLDHCGAIVELNKLAPNMPMYMTEATKALTYKNLAAASGRSEDSFKENYDLDRCLSSAFTVDFRTPFVIKKGNRRLTVELFRAGHILGAAAVYMELDGKGIFFTGDYCSEDQRTVKGMELPEGYNIQTVITEATYGSINKNNVYPRSVEEQILFIKLKSYLEEKDSILIPTFAIGRSQELLLMVKEYFSKEAQIPFRIYIDGLVTGICEIYSKYTGESFRGKGILIANNNQGYGSKEKFIDNEVMHHKSCIISSSGMLKDGSASACYAEKLIDKENALCIITGYQDEESVGGKLRQQMKREGDKYIEINSRIHKVSWEVAEYYLSAHCQLEDIVKLILDIKPSKVLLIHGTAEENKKTELQQYLEYIRGIKVVQTFNGETYKI